MQAAWYILYFVKIHPHVSAKNEEEIRRRGKCIPRKWENIAIFLSIAQEKLCASFVIRGINAIKYNLRHY
jgi:hypothetical protein